MRRLNNTDFLEGENNYAVSIFNNIHSSRLKISNFVLSIKVSIRRSKKIRKTQKRPAEEASPIITPPPNIRDRSSPSLDDYNEASSVIFFFFRFVCCMM